MAADAPTLAGLGLAEAATVAEARKLPTVEEMLPAVFRDKRMPMSHLLEEGARYVALRFMPKAMAMLDSEDVSNRDKIQLFGIIMQHAMARGSGRRTDLQERKAMAASQPMQTAVIALPVRVQATQVLPDGTVNILSMPLPELPMQVLAAEARTALRELEEDLGAN